jgi:hypothetical protein
MARLFEFLALAFLQLGVLMAVLIVFRMSGVAAEVPALALVGVVASLAASGFDWLARWVSGP